MAERTLEDLYGITKKDVNLTRVVSKSGRPLEVFPSPGACLVSIEFPEFTCLCPKTAHPDFATLTISYYPKKVCVELKALKYYLNSFRNEGHFHEQVTRLIYEDMKDILGTDNLEVVSEFNVRGGTYPTVTIGRLIEEEF